MHIGTECLLGCVLCFIPVNLICSMTTFRKLYKNDILTPGVKGMCKDKIFVACYCMLLSAFNLICDITIF